MATRVLFTQVIRDLKTQVGETNTSMTGPDAEEYYKFQINKHYEILADYFWADLRQIVLFNLSPGQQYYTPPPQVTPETITRVYKIQPGLVYEVKKGISAEHYSIPVFDTLTYRYDWVEDDNADKLEIWPIPVRTDEIRFETKRAFAPLVNETDRIYIDHVLVYLGAAIEILNERGRPVDALLKQYQARFEQLRSNKEPSGSITNSLHTRDGADLAVLTWMSEYANRDI